MKKLEIGKYYKHVRSGNRFSVTFFSVGIGLPEVEMHCKDTFGDSLYFNSNTNRNGIYVKDGAFVEIGLDEWNKEV